MWDSFYPMCRLGMLHIADGADHLLFLCSLMMVAPCEITNREWHTQSNWLTTFKRTIGLVTGFTIGHSLSLIFGSLGWVHVRAEWVELLIAVSVAVMAIHSIKPIMLKGELWITTFFGLIHGLAFASTMQELSEDTEILFIELLGFNLGIEAYQVLVICTMLPLLIAASQFKQYSKLRLLFGIFTILAAFIWIWQRMTWQENVLTNWLDVLPKYKWFMPVTVGGLVLVFKLNTKVAKDH